MKQKLLDQIKQKHIGSGGHCGLYISDFVGNLGDIKKALNELFKEKKITVHDGIHRQIIKYCIK
jgi:hypothetical protein